jgi:hypothetical protein
MQHPEEGIIHAWLDGALPDDEAARIHEHVASCSECSERVAEARGLIAASSRITGYLDAIPANVIPAAPQRKQFWFVRSVWPAAIAATLLVAVGIVATKDGREERAADALVQAPMTPALAKERVAVADSGMTESVVATASRARPSPTVGSAASAPSMMLPPAAAAEQKMSIAAAPPSATAPPPVASTLSRQATGGVVADSEARVQQKAAGLIAGLGGARGGGGGGGRGGGATAQRPATTAAVAPAARDFSMAERADAEAVTAGLGCYEMNASTDVIPMRFALVADSSSSLPGFRRVRYVNDQGQLTEPMMDAGWTMEGGRIVIRTSNRGAVLTLSKTGAAVTGESPNGPRTGRVISCR